MFAVSPFLVESKCFKTAMYIYNEYTKSLKKCLFGIVTCRYGIVTCRLLTYRFGIVTHMKVWNCHSHDRFGIVTCRFGIVTCMFGIVTCRNSGQGEDGKKVFQMNLINPSDRMLSIFRRILDQRYLN